MPSKKLRIALVAPPWEAVPPPKYGGVELVVANLADELVARGHDVTLFATGDSHTAARLRYIHPRAGYRAGVAWENHTFPLAHASFAFAEIQRGDFDLVHNHAEYWGTAFAPLLRIPMLTTYHRDLSGLPQQKDFLFVRKLLQQSPLVSISDSQRRNARFPLRWIGRVYNGIKVEQFPFSVKPGKHLLWVGRMSEKKGAHRAIAVAKAASLPLILAAKIDRLVAHEREYFAKQVKPHLNKQIVFVGEVGHREKLRLYKNAKALLMPISWQEPFGLVMTEAMATGTPVIAHGLGAVPEIVVDGKTGYITKTERDMVRAVGRLDEIDRAACRARVEKYFSAKTMAENYEKLYYRILRKK